MELPTQTEIDAIHESVEVEYQRELTALCNKTTIVQTACNLSGVAIAFADVVKKLRTLYPTMGTEEMNTHPIVKLWVNKMANLSGAQDITAKDFEWIEENTKGIEDYE